ncbi:unnamed protein product [Rotaria sp. Silwood1]|nr:unnamed protein product [Rotaria sp. Silwood1]
MLNPFDISRFCDLKPYDLTFGLDPAVINSCPSLNIALRSISLILTNEHIMSNFAPHFIPYNEYDGNFPSSISPDIMNLMKTTFTNSNLPKIILSADVFKDVQHSHAMYGVYKGRQLETDINVIYLNSEFVTYSKQYSDLEKIIQYASVFLFTIIHEIGHWTFHHFSCNMNHDLCTPKGVLMQEAGEAIETMIFGFQLLHYGPEEPAYIVIYN